MVKKTLISLVSYWSGAKYVVDPVKKQIQTKEYNLLDRVQIELMLEILKDKG
jgi:hypothetical protein